MSNKMKRVNYNSKNHMNYRLLYSSAILITAPAFSHHINKDKAFEMVVENLSETAVSRSFLDNAFSHPDITIHNDIADKFNSPWEKKDYPAYKKLFVTESRIAKGTAFYTQNTTLIKAVADSFGVDKYLILSIAGVESNYGVHHAQYTVFNALYSIIHTLPRKEKWAARELSDYLKLCYENGMNPQDISGSYAGAFGYGQFIPSSFKHFSVDFDGDGVRHHLQWPDVLGSIANYLKKNGYKGTDFSKDKPIWKSVWAYNHSENYVRAVLELREELKKNIENPPADPGE